MSSGRVVPCPRCGGQAEHVIGNYVACPACDRPAVPQAIEPEKTGCLHRSLGARDLCTRRVQCMDCRERVDYDSIEISAWSPLDHPSTTVSLNAQGQAVWTADSDRVVGTVVDCTWSEYYGGWYAEIVLE